MLFGSSIRRLIVVFVWKKWFLFRDTNQAHKYIGKNQPHYTNYRSETFSKAGFGIRDCFVIVNCVLFWPFEN